MVTLADLVFELGDSVLVEVDMVEDETALCSVFEGFDDTNGEGGVGLGKSEIGGCVVDAV